MSPRKLTEDDKQEILQLYRNSQATTSTLANNYEVSSSTISRFLKNKLSTSEYEDLIQQKRLARTPRGEKSSEKESKTKTKSPKTKLDKSKNAATAEVTMPSVIEEAIDKPETELKPSVRRRRRSNVTEEPIVAEVVPTQTEDNQPEELVEAQTSNSEEPLTAKQPNKLIIDKQPRGTVKNSSKDTEELASYKSNSLILKADRVDLEDEDGDDDDDDNGVDIITLKEMLGEDLEDINDDNDDDDDDWEDDNEDGITYHSKSSNLSDVQILPLSQASFPRTCYLVIDRSAELIVKPLADFADLGAIPQAEVRETTLPVFDNHRIAKRFSHRRERVIKVPDGRMLQKTSHYLQNKGITRLLIDGQIYSLSN
ncbi:hypothetical protein [Pleurocapsa sp. FMAR1]|uniref:hypothetical protein n=1 Tax=Pleurocapsa sp. FMAR1 TaxID=3040204 RepID=UPI0029C8C85F|nr:hypothetical protein [Pleurocapsa sp. FMAR1]